MQSVFKRETHHRFYSHSNSKGKHKTNLPERNLPGKARLRTAVQARSILDLYQIYTRSIPLTRCGATTSWYATWCEFIIFNTQISSFLIRNSSFPPDYPARLRCRPRRRSAKKRICLVRKDRTDLPRKSSHTSNCNNNRPFFNQTSHHFSGAILHYLCIFNSR